MYSFREITIWVGMACMSVVLAAVTYGFLTRYEIVATATPRPCAYEVDRLTGKVWFIVSNQKREVNP